ncbi:outer membrane protein assembly factor BamA precursor [mine drainage metagenome]|uniref:Outer membrane protein assembly factor BamA n=1 Tax=mine drainage metagenome TaxID=410659 RepID=A0A1J5RS91_9ZZZZ
MVRLFRSAFIAAAIALLALAPMIVGPAYAQEGGVVHDIVVQGNQRIEADTIRSYMALNPGDSFDDAKLDKSLKALFATGLFADVTMHREGDTLMVRVVENPIINRVAFEGNHHMKSEDLNKEVQLKPRTVYTRTKVQSDVKRILEVYRRSGRFAVTVDPKIIQLEQNRVDLVFEIHEGDPTYVTRIDFIGNKKYDDNALRETLQTKEERWYRFFSSDDTYDPDRVNYDRELLRRFYLKNGYADFRVVSSVAELTPDRKKFFLTFTLEEGERYKVGSIKVKSDIPDLKTAILEKEVTFEKGDWYNADAVEKTVQALTDAAGNKGYAFVDVRPELVRHRDSHIIDITFNIQQGPRVFVERIDITGNVRTLDKVIRREMRLVEGDAFNTAKLRRSEQRLKDLDFFDKVNVTNVASETAPDRTVIKVDVKEKSTGQLSFGVGWSSTLGPLLQVGASENNVLGTGQMVSIQGQLALKGTSISAGYTDPYFLDRQLIAGVDLFDTTTYALQDISAFDETTVGGDLRLGYYFNEYLRQDWRYTASVTQVSNVMVGSSLYILDQQGTTTLSMIGHTLTWDHRDSKVDPTRGFVMSYGNDLAGLGGDQNFVRTNVRASQYFPVTDDMVAHFGIGGGYMNPWGGKSVNITQRYYLGGDTLRGFRDFDGVSPRDLTTLDALGGMWEYNGTAELTFPVGFPKEMGVKGKLFTDFGSIGPVNSGVPTDSVLQSSSLRLSVGTGIVWKSPMGPIDIDFGIPILKQSYDQDQIFRLNFGTRF